MKTKDRLGKSTTPGPAVSRDGNCGLPSSGEEGLGVVELSDFGGLCGLGGKQAFCHRSGERLRIWKEMFFRGNELSHLRQIKDLAFFDCSKRTGF
jgi:hypothetical protein